MQKELTEDGVSEAKLAANRANAKKSTGPSLEGRRRTRFNARKHGLTGKCGLPGLDTPENRGFVRLGFNLIAPRNAVEATYVRSLLLSRLREELFLTIEREVFTRKPVPFEADDQRPYLFLQDPDSLRTLDALTRHLAHLTSASEKELLALLRVREEGWPEGSQSASGGSAQPVEDDRATATETEEATGDSIFLPGTLEYCQAQTSLVLPDESLRDYENLVRDLWATFAPANTLEGFVITDFIQGRWRLERILRIQGLLLERSAISSSGQNCGVGFAFINDSQGNQSLGSLRAYENVLRRRMDKRMALLRRLRNEGWADCVPTSGMGLARQSEAASASASILCGGTSTSAECGPIPSVKTDPTTNPVPERKNDSDNLVPDDQPSCSSSANCSIVQIAACNPKPTI